MFKGDRIRGTLVDTALFGAIFVLVCDMIARTVIAPYELPIELIVGIVGSILFIGLLLYRYAMAVKQFAWGCPQRWMRRPNCPGRTGGRSMKTAAYRANVRKLIIMQVWWYWLLPPTCWWRSIQNILPTP